MGRVQMSGQEGRPTPTVPNNALDAPGIASRRTAAQQQQASLNQRYEFVRFLEYFKEKKLKPPHDKFVHDINRQVLTHAISFEEYTTTLKKTLNEIWPEIIREFQGHMVRSLFHFIFELIMKPIIRLRYNKCKQLKQVEWGKI